MDEIYAKLPSDKIPWNMEKLPEAVVRLIEDGGVKPCKTIDLGCGVGNYAVYLAEMGFDVTGVDISTTAIKMANDKVTNKACNCKFIAANVIGNLNEINASFDFAFEWEMLHHIFPENREGYVQNVHKILNSNGKYLSVCFSQKDTHFGGVGKFRKTRLGTVLYFSTEDELRKLFEPYFTILELKTIEVVGKTEPHMAVYCFMEKIVW